MPITTSNPFNTETVRAKFAKCQFQVSFTSSDVDGGILGLSTELRATIKFPSGACFQAVELLDIETTDGATIADALHRLAYEIEKGCAALVEEGLA